MRIDSEVIKTLAHAGVDGNTLRLTEQLDRNTYLAVAKVLKGIGGKWNSGKKCHIFDTDVEDIIQNIILTGEYTNERTVYQFFPTPRELAEHMARIADIQQGENCLEPSAGVGNIAQFMPGCDCIELNPKNRETLITEGYNVIAEDFMTFEPEKDYDVIIMNPPFCKQQDIEHVTKAIHIAKRCVVAVMSASVLWRTDKKTLAFRELVEKHGGTIEALPENAFKESGTTVNTCLVIVRKEQCQP